MASKCPECGKDGERAIYYGLPIWICRDHRDEGDTWTMCPFVWGFWMTFLILLPFNGSFFVYRGVSYPRALWVWLTLGDGETP